MKILLLILALFAVVRADAGDPAVIPLPDIDARFVRDSGWTGADGAYSVRLPDGRVAWLFSDTWIGRIENGSHRDSAIIDNSVGIQSGASIDFFYKLSGERKPEPIFTASSGAFWIYDGVAIGDRLHLFLQRVEKDGDSGFRHVGTTLATVLNPGDPPPKWRYDHAELPFGRFGSDGDTLFGSSVLRDGGFVYVFGTTETIEDGFHRKSLIAARVRESKFTRFDSWRFFDGKRWRRDWRLAAPLADRFANEFTISYQPKLRKFVAVHTPDGISPEIAIRTAPTPVGPWSAPRVVYRCPEAARGPKVICYAAKAHPSISGPDELVVSYVPSSTDFWRIATDSTLYLPKFFKVVWR